MSLVFPDGSRTVTLAPPPKRQIEGQYRPTQSPMNQAQQMLEFLYQQLKAQYPQISEPDLREAAKRMMAEIATKQAQDFNERFFPERAQQTAQQPGYGMVAPNEQRPWQYSPGSPGGVRYGTMPPQEDPQAVRMRQIADEQEKHAKALQDFQEQHRRKLGILNNRTPTTPGGFMPGAAQPVAAPAQGTPYDPTKPPQYQIGVDGSKWLQGNAKPTDQEIAAMNAAEKAKPNNQTRYYRMPDGTVGIAQ